MRAGWADHTEQGEGHLVAHRNVEAEVDSPVVGVDNPVVEEVDSLAVVGDTASPLGVDIVPAEAVGSTVGEEEVVHTAAEHILEVAAADSLLAVVVLHNPVGEGVDNLAGEDTGTHPGEAEALVIEISTTAGYRAFLPEMDATYALGKEDSLLEVVVLLAVDSSQTFASKM
jgi:hypothetical protein